MSGGGGNSGGGTSIPTSTTSSQTTIPDYAAPYVQQMLGAGAGTVFNYQQNPGGGYATDATGMPNITGFQGYQQYPGQQVAQFTPLQQQAFQGAEQMQAAPQLGDATGAANQATYNALNTQYNYNPYRTQSALGPVGGQRGFFDGMGGGQGMMGGLGGLPGGMQDQNSQQMQGPQGQGMGGGYMPGRGYQPQSNVSAYMSPYMQNVVDVQSQAARRAAGQAGAQQQAQATQAGAFGGGRDAVMRAQGNAGLQQNLAGIQATGSQAAYNQALQQFNTEQQARQSAAQLNAQQQQFGAGLGLQGAQTALTGANTLGTLGQTQYGQNMGINQLQNAVGTQQQQGVQNVLNSQMNNFRSAADYPQQQLGFMSNLLRGLPISQQASQTYNAPPSALSQIGGLGLTAASMGYKPFAKGGQVKESDGLAGLALARMGK